MNVSPTQRRTLSKWAPLSYERTAILIALSAGPLDKKDVADAVMADTLAHVVLKTSTTYYLISELAQQGYIKEQGPFCLTDKGRHALKIEFSRIERERQLLLTRLHM